MLLIRADEFEKNLDLECLVPSRKKEWDIRTPDTNRPGMQFCGYYEFFAYERPQIVGKVEMSYLEEKSPAQRLSILTQYFSYDLPCVIVCRNINPPEEMLMVARNRGIPVYRSKDVTTRFTARIIHYLTRTLAPHVMRHGVLMNVYGIGVFLAGKSGAGKSEAALELIKRGHQLVADDVVDICKVSDSKLIGSCPPAIRYLMEIRGIGLIDIRALYGVSAVEEDTPIDLILELVSWDEDRSYDRVGLEDDHIEILGVPIVRQLMPVQPGRNLAIIVEVAARNLSLKRMGYNPAAELNQRLLKKQQMAREEEE